MLHSHVIVAMTSPLWPQILHPVRRQGARQVLSFAKRHQSSHGRARSGESAEREGDRESECPQGENASDDGLWRDDDQRPALLVPHTGHPPVRTKNATCLAIRTSASGSERPSLASRCDSEKDAGLRVENGNEIGPRLYRESRRRARNGRRGIPLRGAVRLTASEDGGEIMPPRDRSDGAAR